MKNYLTEYTKPDILSFQITKPADDTVFSILIPTWNNLEYLKLCIKSIQQNSTYRHQIIIHVNEGTDGTLEWVQQLKTDYTYSKINAGVCYAVNAMAALAYAKYIVYMNDDMYVCKNWDKYLYDAALNKKDGLFYYSATMIEPDDTGNACVISNKNFGLSPENFDETALLSFAEKADTHDWFGSCWPPSMVTKKIWDAVGGYSEEFSPGFYSDPDFAMKLWQLGVRDFRGFGKSLVYHFKCKSTGRVQRNNGRKTFAKKWGITASYFYKHVLLMGQPCEQNTVLQLRKNFYFYLSRIKSYFM